ncbi:MAG: LOG family protein [Chloroflexi bacterium]|nr:LOG family protein [Chloroflexota bacterium]
MAARVVVFGASAPKPGDPAYQRAYHLGQALARAGYIVITGGYIGTMEAVSRGAAEAGGHVIGVTCEQIERWRPVGPNRWLHEEWRTRTLLERLERMLTHGDAFLALPGGVGTLTEILLTWNHLLIRALPPRPLILIGQELADACQRTQEALAAYFPPAARHALLIASDPEDAVRILRAHVPPQEEP